MYELSPLEFYKSLADDTRLRCLFLIEREEELCVCELMEALDETQPKISRHLAQLRQNHLLSSRRQGQWVFYRLSEDLPVWAREQLTMTRQANPEFLQHNVDALAMMGNRPDRLLECCS